MIGDTPESDIQGANLKAKDGWISVLVRTGLFSEGENSPDYPARYVCEDVEEAIKLIFQIEGVDREINSSTMMKD
jgi:ribonucleotide monophosphatase NagD (HAD superfamily)